MRYNVVETHDKPTDIDIQASGSKECAKAMMFMRALVEVSDETPEPEAAPAHGHMVITMDNLAEALAILNQRKRCKLEFYKFIRRITTMGMKEAKEWTDAHFDRWHK